MLQAVLPTIGSQGIQTERQESLEPDYLNTVCMPNLYLNNIITHISLSHLPNVRRLPHCIKNWQAITTGATSGQQLQAGGERGNKDSQPMSQSICQQNLSSAKEGWLLQANGWSIVVQGHHQGNLKYPFKYPYTNVHSLHCLLYALKPTSVICSESHKI